MRGEESRRSLLVRIHSPPLVALYYATICLERGPLLDRRGQPGEPVDASVSRDQGVQRRRVSRECIVYHRHFQTAR
jgi:hypothetical protein